MDHLHGPEIGFTKNENVLEGHGGDHEFGHRFLDSYGERPVGGDRWMGHQTGIEGGTHHGAGVEHDSYRHGDGSVGGGGEHVGGYHGIGVPLGFYGGGGGMDATVANEDHHAPYFLYGGAHDTHDDNHLIHHSTEGHLGDGGTHHGLAEMGFPMDDHPAHYLFRQFATGHNVGSADYEHSLDDHIRHHALHSMGGHHGGEHYSGGEHGGYYGVENGHGSGIHGLHNNYHGPHDHFHNSEVHNIHDVLDHRLANPLDYHIPHFPSRQNSERVNHFFRHEIDRIVQHVNEFPLISDKIAVHPSVFRDQLNIVPSEDDIPSFRHRMHAGGRYASGGVLIGAGTAGYGAVGRPAVGIGIAAGGAAGAGKLMDGKTPPIKALLEATTKEFVHTGSIHHGEEGSHHEIDPIHHHDFDLMHDLHHQNMIHREEEALMHHEQELSHHEHEMMHHHDDEMHHHDDEMHHHDDEMYPHDNHMCHYCNNMHHHDDMLHHGIEEENHEQSEAFHEEPKLPYSAYQTLTSEGAGGGVPAGGNGAKQKDSSPALGPDPKPKIIEMKITTKKKPGTKVEVTAGGIGGSGPAPGGPAGTTGGPPPPPAPPPPPKGQKNPYEVVTSDTKKPVREVIESMHDIMAVNNFHPSRNDPQSKLEQTLKEMNLRKR